MAIPQIHGTRQIQSGSVASDRLSSAELKALAGLSSAADKLAYFTGSGSADLASLTSYGRSLIAAADAAAARVALGVTASGDVQPHNSALDQIAAGTWAGATSITTVGDITTGAWKATQIAPAYLPSLDAFTAPSAAVSLNSQKITNLADPTNAQDAATKNYVDLLKAGMQMKDAVKVRSTSNVNISSPGVSIDGVTLANGDRVLLNNQTDAKQNGVYVFHGSSSAMTRAADFDGSNSNVAEGDYVFVTEGSAPGIGFILVTISPVVGTSNLSFIEFTRLNSVSVGNGLVKTNQGLINLVLDGSTLAKSGSGLKVAAAGITSTELASSVAGAGLSGGAGSALAVQVAGVMAIDNSNKVAIQMSGADITSFNSTHFANTSGQFGIAGSGVGTAEIAPGAVTAAKIGYTPVAEKLSGTFDGSNTSYSLSHAPSAACKVLLFINGLMLLQGEHFTLSGANISTSSAPGADDRLDAVYFY